MTSIALFISGQLREFPVTVPIVNHFIDLLQAQNSHVDVFVCTDQYHNSLQTLKNVKQTFFVTEFEDKAHLHVQMSRLAFCYSQIKDADKYDWFIKIRPDYIIDVLTFPFIKDWNPNKINCKIRYTNNKQLKNVKLFSSWQFDNYNHWDIRNPDVPDDQLFIVPKSLHKQAFLLEFGNFTIPTVYDNPYGQFPELKQANLWYSHNISVHPIAFKGTLLRYRRSIGL
jgi:hypothetical protein